MLSKEKHCDSSCIRSFQSSKYRRKKERNARASLCHNLGVALVRSDPNKAMSYLELALEKFSNLGDYFHASTTATNIAAFSGHRDPKKAEKYCKMAMDYMEKTEEPDEINLGILLTVQRVGIH